MTLLDLLFGWRGVWPFTSSMWKLVILFYLEASFDQSNVTEMNQIFADFGNFGNFSISF